MIIIIIDPISILSEDEWGELECLYEACQAGITDGGIFTDTDINERKSENDCEMKTVSQEKGPEKLTGVRANRLRRKELIKEKGFEFK